MSYTTKAQSLTEVTKRINAVASGWKSLRTRKGTLQEETQAIAIQCLIQLDQTNPNYDALSRHIKAVGADTVNGKALIKWAQAFSPVFMNFEEKSKAFIGCKKDKSTNSNPLNIAGAEEVNYWEFKEAPVVRDLTWFQEADDKFLSKARKALSDGDYIALLATRRSNSKPVGLAAQTKDVA